MVVLAAVWELMEVLLVVHAVVRPEVVPMVEDDAVTC